MLKGCLNLSQTMNFVLDFCHRLSIVYCLLRPLREILDPPLTPYMYFSSPQIFWKYQKQLPIFNIRKLNGRTTGNLG